MDNKTKVLVIGTASDALARFNSVLDPERFSVSVSQSYLTAMEMIRRYKYDVVVYNSVCFDSQDRQRLNEMREMNLPFRIVAAEAGDLSRLFAACTDDGSVHAGESTDGKLK